MIECKPFVFLKTGLFRGGIVVFLLSATFLSGRAAVLLDDTWADGTRTDQNLPTESAWFASTGAALTSTTGTMTLTMGGSAILAVTYFTVNESSPAQLEVGETLSATFSFTFNSVAAANSSQGFRLGLFNFADSTLSPKRVSADFSGNNGMGSGVQGYALFQNMGVTFNNSSPMDIRKRTNVGDGALLGTSGDWTSLATGPGNIAAFPGFIDGTNYVLQLSLQRIGATSLSITMTWVNTGNGATLSTSVTDNSATNFSFDGIALRPQNASSSASSVIFRELKVELIPGSTPPVVDDDPQHQTVFTGQDASFSVSASGTGPLSYQWYYDTDTLLSNATNSSLVLTNVQLEQAGGYFVIVTNDYGSVTSAVATLTVNEPVAPSIVTHPEDQIAPPGDSVQFTVIAGGSEPLIYQWYFNTNTPIANANDPILTLNDVQLSDAGAYSVVVSNVAGFITSSNAFLAINTNPVAPAFISQPASLVVLAGSAASFTANAAGTAPITYQWSKNGVPVPNANSPTLTLTNVQSGDAGTYVVTASNSVDAVSSDPATLTVTPAIPVPDTAYNLTGFGQATTGGGVIPDTDAAYRKVYTPLDFALAIQSANKTAGSVKVVEIMNDLDLGWNEIGTDVQNLSSNPFRSHSTPKLHPRLLTVGVSLIDIKSKSGLTIFSANGSTIRHATFNIKDTANIIVRNLKFDEMWEWDEASKGDYDGNDWDFIDLGNGGGTVHDVWIDHCTFTKAYDGICDIKGGAYNITFSWCKYVGDDGATNTNSWVRQQINYLEQNPGSHPMYNFLRTHGFSVEDIVTIIQGHDKTHLIGANSLSSENAQHAVTFHHQWYTNPWDRLPRLRAGNVHNYNIYVNDTLGLAAKRLRDLRAAALSPADQNTLNNTYSFKPFLNGSISTENGAVLIEKSVYIDCLTPLRNNQTDPSNPVYTGKIMALDSIYQFDNTVVRGNSTDPGNPLGPFQAPAIPFSWNLPGNQLPYDYNMDDPGQLETIVTNPTRGAGSGVLAWDKTNWLKTAYAPTAPVIVADPQSQVVAVSNNVTFTAVAGGSAPLSYQWYFNTNTMLGNATNTFLTLTNVQSTNAGAYFVVVANSAGSVTSLVATLTVGATGFESWRTAEFTSEQLSDPLISGPDATPANDGVANFVKYALGLEPFVPATQPLVQFDYDDGNGVLTYHRPATATDVIYRVEVCTNLPDWTEAGVTQQLTGTDGGGLQIWEAHYSGSNSSTRYFHLVLERP